jgi:hypothetical protein
MRIEKCVHGEPLSLSVGFLPDDWLQRLQASSLTLDYSPVSARHPSNSLTSGFSIQRQRKCVLTQTIMTLSYITNTHKSWPLHSDKPKPGSLQHLVSTLLISLIIQGYRKAPVSKIFFCWRSTALHTCTSLSNY